MKSELLDAGQIVNTHGIRGEVKILPWCDAPEFLLSFSRVSIDDRDIAVERSRVQGTCVLMKLAGVDDVNAAMKLRNKTVKIYRQDVELEEGASFIADLIGLPVLFQDQELGTIRDVLQLPSNDVYVVQGEHAYMIPVVREFIEEVNVEAGYVKVHLIEGMQTDE